MHLNRENTWEPVRIQFSLSGVARLHRSAAKAASHSGKAKVVGWHCRRAKVRSQFPAPGEGCAESAAGVMGDPRDRTTIAPVLGIQRDRCAGREARRRRGRRRRGVRGLSEYVPIRFRFRCVFLADGTRGVYTGCTRSVNGKASLYAIPVIFCCNEGMSVTNEV